MDMEKSVKGFPMMQRELSGLKDTAFDVLIIGGGIYGAWSALDACLRGLKVAIIDKNDWASGTSSASTKLIHGGLRYLENFRLDLVQKTLKERAVLAEIAPHLILPLEFLIPIYKNNRVGRIQLKSGLLLYDFLAGKDQPVPPHKSVSKERIVSQYPSLTLDGLKGGFIYGDCQTDDFRFTLNVIACAMQNSAVAANYIKALDPVFQDSKITGVKVVDQLTGDNFEIKTKTIINTAGPWLPLFNEKFAYVKPEYFRFSKGVHLIMPALPAKKAILLMSGQDSRIFFIIPWYGKTLLGTTDEDYIGDPDLIKVTNEDVSYLLTEVNRFFGKQTWTKDDVISSFAGLRILKNELGKKASQVSREWSMKELVPGVLVSIGGKFTSARIDSSKMINKIMKLLKKSENKKTPTENYKFPAGPEVEFKKWAKTEIDKIMQTGLDQETATWCVTRHGTGTENIRQLIMKQPALAERIIPETAFSKAELIYVAGNEMAIHLEDVLRRRIPLLLLARLDRRAIQDIANMLAPEMGWHQETINEEIQMVINKWEIQ